jgi:hypothetical protein
MKKLLLILLCLPFIGFAQKTYVPDDNFEQDLINQGYDNILDDSVLTAYINTVTFLQLTNNIADLTGIEDFISLTTLWLGTTSLTNLDVSQNIALTELDCSSNQLTSLDVSNNTNLANLRCNHNQLTSLDLSQNTALTYLSCYNNQLTSIDVSNNTVLTKLSCWNNQLTSIDVSNNTALTKLSCSDNQLTTLDVSSNIALDELICSSNQLITLDVSSNITLDSLFCGYQQQLTNLDLRNGNNTNISWNLSTNNCPNLYCISVDDVAWATANWTVANGNIDSWANFSANCNLIYGCTDSLACNYDPLAVIDDSSCYYGTIYTFAPTSACDSFMLGNSVYYTTGVYVDTIPISNGCDSIVNFTVYIIQSTFSYDTVSVTTSVYTWNSITITTSGDYSDTLINSVGCDSIAYLNLTITNTTGLLDVTNTEKTLLKITDILGQETPYKRNTPLFYIYDDGTVEKRIVIE